MIFNVNSGKGQDENLLPENIREGVEIDGVIGEYNGDVLFNKPVCQSVDGRFSETSIKIAATSDRVTAIIFKVTSNAYLYFYMMFDPNNYNNFVGYVCNHSKQKTYDATSYISHTVSGTSHTFVLDNSDLYNASYDGKMYFSRYAMINFTIDNNTVTFNYPTQSDSDAIWLVTVI